MSHTLEEDFAHFLSYSKMSGESQEVKDKLYLAFKAAWEPTVNEEKPALARHLPDQKTQKQIENNFTYHAPLPDQPDRYVDIRDRAKSFAYLLTMHCPPSRELSAALESLDLVVLWARAAMERNEG